MRNLISVCLLSKFDLFYLRSIETNKDNILVEVDKCLLSDKCMYNFLVEIDIVH